ncbi:OB-fold protein [Seonamhaeicola marinus]|uniref:tRNA_anti-like n=1 Tax=Seonamhaeicola marinus TaxID=1912246 RepID=A0A5D0JEC3_9FLAO|nr:hypothetical protein [Seonamhaeicola marinus]TYA92242.1 hypothetical protein FUA24_02075 [Seonamhaeicola marinus]
MKKKLIIALIPILIGVLIYNYVYKDHRDIETEKAEFSFTSTELSNEFAVAPSDSEKKYLNKTIEVKGDVTEVNTSNIVIDGNIFCQFLNPIKDEIKTNQKLTIKGRCIGYDDLLEEIKLDQCSIKP